jgi:signal transduction histidine kinase
MPLAFLGWRVEIFPFLLYANIFMTCIYVMLAFKMWRRHAQGGGVIFIAVIISTTGIVIFLMHILGMIDGGFFVWHSLQFTALGNEIALYLNLGARYQKLSRERVRAEQDAKHEREERVRQGHFLAMLAHELRTSLTVLRMAIGSQPMTQRTIAKAERAMDSMGEVIDQSVQVEKLADGNVTIERIPCDIVALVQAVIADGRDPGRIRSHLSVPLVLKTDGRLLRIVISNLVDNALKYGKRGEPVYIDLVTEGAYPCLLVRNAIGSAGLPDAKRVFDKYYRAPQAHAFSGSGLGLHIAAALARILGGELLYQPTSEQVIFEFRLQGIASFAAPSLI